MCDCEPCMQWQKDACGHVGSSKCKNITHCSCCAGSHCLGCNHKAIPLSDSEAIHYHANILRKDKRDYSPNDWVIVQKMELMQIEVR